ncbi:MAG: 50S ribosomal protein L24 [Candidatus Aenigmarchaeota archaeon]|nr:50S ribosomal protein L24 [Candidatus Aenigmarchaeota archaeon]
MVHKCSRSWFSSTKPRNQRKARRFAPLHLRERLLRTALSNELSQKYETRAMPVRLGDKVKVMKGSHKGKLSKVSRVDHIGLKVYLEDIKVKKADGREVQIPFQACNLQILSLFTDDKRRLKSLERKKKRLAKEGKTGVEKVEKPTEKEKPAKKPEGKKSAPKVEK